MMYIHNVEGLCIIILYNFFVFGINLERDAVNLFKFVNASIHGTWDTISWIYKYVNANFMVGGKHRISS